MPNKKTVECAGCGVGIEYEPLVIFGNEVFAPTFCDKCSEANERQSQKERDMAEIERRRGLWRVICPEEYQDTRWERVIAKSPGFAQTVEQYKIGMLTPYFIGTAGTCKTRAAFEILRRQHFAGGSVFAVSSRRFAWAASRSFDNDLQVRGQARENIEKCRNAKLLLLDDLGKEKLTDTVEGELYDLLEHRTSTRRPTIWTANSDGQGLAAKLSEDRREAILRRLFEFGTRAKER